MLHKWIPHIALVLLFAITQMGATTHEITHLSHAAQETLPDQHTTPDPCSQCLAYTQSAAGTPAEGFVVPLIQAQHLFAVTTVYRCVPSFANTYRARAPPAILS